jgi:hypothetical protein
MSCLYRVLHEGMLLHPTATLPFWVNFYSMQPHPKPVSDANDNEHRFAQAAQ